MTVSVGAWKMVSCLPLAMYIIMEVMVLRSRKTVEEVAVICERAASESSGRSVKDDKEFAVESNPLSAAL